MMIKSYRSNKTLTDIVSYGSATFVAAVLTFIVEIIARRVLGPEHFGIWLTVSLVFIYIPLFHLGTINAMNREIPFYAAKNQRDRINEIKNVVWTSVFGIPLLLSLMIVVFGLISKLLFHIDVNVAAAISLAGCCSFLMTLSTYLEMLCKSEQEFNKVSKLIYAKNVTRAIVTLLGVRYFGLNALFLGICLSLIIELFLGRKILKGLSFRINSKMFLEMIRIGFPIMLVGASWSLLTGIDRIIVSIFLPSTDVGYYGVGLLVYSTIMMLPTIINQVMYPKFPELYAKTGEPLSLVKLMDTTNKKLVFIFTLLIGFVYIYLPVLINTILPEYSPGILAAKILVIGIYPITMVGMGANVLNTLSMQKLYLKALGIGGGVNILLSSILCFPFGILGVAIGTTVSYIVYSFLLDKFIVSNINCSQKRAGRIIRTWGPFMQLIVPAIAIDFIVDHIILKSIIFIALCILFIILNLRKSELLPNLTK